MAEKQRLINIYSQNGSNSRIALKREDFRRRLHEGLSRSVAVFTRILGQHSVAGSQGQPPNETDFDLYVDCSNNIKPVRLYAKLQLTTPEGNISISPDCTNEQLTAQIENLIFNSASPNTVAITVEREYTICDTTYVSEYIRNLACGVAYAGDVVISTFVSKDDSRTNPDEILWPASSNAMEMNVIRIAYEVSPTFVIQAETGQDGTRSHYFDQEWAVTITGGMADQTQGILHREIRTKDGRSPLRRVIHQQQLAQSPEFHYQDGVKVSTVRYSQWGQSR